MAENPIRDSKLGRGALIPRVQRSADRRQAKAIETMARGRKPAEVDLRNLYLREGYPPALANLIVRLAYPGKRRVTKADGLRGKPSKPLYTGGMHERDGRLAEQPVDRFFPKSDLSGKRMPPPAPWT